MYKKRWRCRSGAVGSSLSSAKPIFIMHTNTLAKLKRSIVAANNRETKFHLLKSIKSPFIHHFSFKPPLMLKSPRHIKSSGYDGQYLFFIRCNKNFIAQSPTRASWVMYTSDKRIIYLTLKCSTKLSVPGDHDGIFEHCLENQFSNRKWALRIYGSDTIFASAQFYWQSWKLGQIPKQIFKYF